MIVPLIVTALLMALATAAAAVAVLIVGCSWPVALAVAYGYTAWRFIYAMCRVEYARQLIAKGRKVSR
jgi:hypothetical protein